MKKIAFGIILIVVFLIGVVATTLVQQYYFPQTATVSTVKLAIYLNGALLPNGTTIEWGTVNASETYTYDLDVKNIGGVPCRVMLILQDLPSGWTETWTANNTVTSPSGWANGTLSLTVALTAEGAYSWKSWIRGEQT